MKPRPKVVEPATSPTPAAGVLEATRVIDRYEIVAVIGRGAAGAVYRAVDLRLGRTVALKTASGSRDGARLTDRVRQRFLREAMALSKVDQRNVVQVLDYGFADDGTPFLVMEHLRGRDLGAFLALAEGPLPIAEVADIGLGVCAALRACHRVGIIHRDLKPADVFLVDTDTGVEIKVLDFGVSMAAAADDRTRQAPLLPASHHLAPEQIDGKVGPASDQYALGVLLHFCLTRRFPAPLRGRGHAPDVQLPAALEAVLRRATRVTPAERFESVYALGRELLEFASPRGQAQWSGYYRPDPDQRPPWAVLSPTKRLRAARAMSTGDARAAGSTKLSRRPPDAPVRASGTWPLRAATVGCVALAATGLTVTRRRPPKPVPPSAARREIAPPPRRPSMEHAPLRPRERAPAIPAATVTEAALGPVSPPEAPEQTVAVSRRRAKTAAPTPPAIPNMDGEGIWIPEE